ncbi:hypothetical protein DTM11_28385 [Escherichia coli]|nr:hypothetical protein DTM11_28385 [Escherichia coli]
MRIEICIAKEKMTKMPTGAVDALKEELTRRISKRYDDVEVIVKATSNDGLSVTRTADKDSAKTFVQETLKDTWEPDQQTRHHRHSKIHQACHIPCTWIKTAPPRHIHTLAMPEHFNPAIFCLGVFTRNEERTTGYRSVSPVPGKKTNQ